LELGKVFICLSIDLKTKQEFYPFI